MGDCFDDALRSEGFTNGTKSLYVYSPLSAFAINYQLQYNCVNRELAILAPAINHVFHLFSPSANNVERNWKKTEEGDETQTTYARTLRVRPFIWLFNFFASFSRIWSQLMRTIFYTS